MPKAKGNGSKAKPTSEPPKGHPKYCGTCCYPRPLMTYGNKTQARQAAKANKTPLVDDTALCTNLEGGVHIAVEKPTVVADD